MTREINTNVFVGRRLIEERERLHMTQAQMAAAIGVHVNSLSNYEGGKRSPRGQVLNELARAGVDVPYVLEGRRRQAGHAAATGDGTAAPPRVSVVMESSPGWGKQLADGGAGTQRTRAREPLLPVAGSRSLSPLVMVLPIDEDGAKSVEYQLIPRMIGTASAGSGGVEQPMSDSGLMDLAGEMAFSFDWLQHNLGHTSGNVASIRVSGNSMAPTLLDGDTILVDLHVRAVDVDGIYVLDVYGRRVVKRVQHLFDGTLVLISDNETYQREQVPRDQARDVTVVGRMVWPRVR